METEPGECSQCGKQATMRCAGCTGAPEYEPGDATTIFYCGRDCQTKHWRDHKSQCRIMKRRKKLLRAATILQTALLTYRDVRYDYDLTKVEEKDGILYLYQNERADTDHVKRGPFPNHLTTNVQHKAAALTINQCTAAIALLSRLAYKLLEGVCSTLKVLDVALGRILFQPTLTPGPRVDNWPHTSIKVNMLSPTESWVIDTTGCQYGYRETLVPYDKYMATRSRKLLNLGIDTLYTWFETKDLDSWSISAYSTDESPAQTQDRAEERRARLHFANFVKNRVGVDILDGSTSEFDEKLASFENMLKTHMLGFYDS